MAESYTEWFWILIEKLWDLLNSNFITALAGAIFGALAAYIIAKKHQRSELLLQEIRNTNSAITLSYSIFNSFLSLKDQIIKPIVADFEETAKLHDEYMVKLELGEHVQFDGVASMFDIVIPFVPTESISEIVFGKIAAPSRVIVMVSEMIQSVAVIKEMSELRRTIISEYKLDKDATDVQKMQLYLGLVKEGGEIDERFPHAIKEISESVDHCIFYSYTIGEDLHKYGVKLAKQYGKKAPGIVAIKLPKELLEKNLMPDEENYRGWSEGFEPDQNANQNKSIWDRLKFWSS